MPAAQKNRKTLIRIIKRTFVCGFLLLIIILTSLNIKGYLSPSKIVVLAASTEISPETFWKDFLRENDNYIPGWIEIGRLDKASQIDPNYFYNK